MLVPIDEVWEAALLNCLFRKRLISIDLVIALQILKCGFDSFLPRSTFPYGFEIINAAYEGIWYAKPMQSPLCMCACSCLYNYILCGHG